MNAVRIKTATWFHSACSTAREHGQQQARCRFRGLAQSIFGDARRNCHVFHRNIGPLPGRCIITTFCGKLTGKTYRAILYFCVESARMRGSS